MEDEGQIHAFLRETAPGVVFHLATVSQPTGRENEGWAVNVEWTTTLARLSAELGIRFAFAHFINPDYGDQVARAYRRQFQPGFAAAPHSAVALFVIAADTQAEADDLAAAVDLRRLTMAYGMNVPIPSVAQARSRTYTAREMEVIEGERPRSIIGTPEAVRDRVLALREAFAADEVVVLTVAATYAARLRSHELLAEAFGLGR